MINASSAMKAGGFYNKNSTYQKFMIERGLHLVEEAAALTPLPTAAKGTFRIADLGCSQGGNSVAPVATVLRVLQSRARGGEDAGAGVSASGGSGPGSRPPALNVEVVHEDLPGNDWRSLFGVVYGEGSYMPGPGECPDLEVFATAVGRSYYERLFPTASVHLAMAFTCLHWQPSIPDRRPTDTLSANATADKEVYEAFRKSANDHLRTFFALRGAEVVPGGSLVCNILTHTPGRDEVNPINQATSDAALQMVSEGLLGSEDIADMTIPLFCYDANDVLAILQETADTWTANVAEEVRPASPVFGQLQGGKVASGELPRTITAGLRAVGEPHYLRVLTRRHGAEAAERLVDGLYGRAEGFIRKVLESLHELQQRQGADGEEEAFREAATSLSSSVLYLWLQRK